MLGKFALVLLSICTGHIASFTYLLFSANRLTRSRDIYNLGRFRLI